jgi:hypothetical protein
MKPNHYLNPYLAGIMLGLALLASFLILGDGRGPPAAWPGWLRPWKRL